MKKRTIISLISVILIISIAILIPNTVQETYAASTTLADKVISLSQGSTWSSGASGVYNSGSGEYRYIGANVNNFVKFNNDMYRIIGVFDGAVHGNIGKNLVKLIRSRPIGSYSWGVYSNTSGSYLGYANDWTGNDTGVKANLNILLNEYFYNKTSTSSTYGDCSNWTYYYNNTNYRTNDCSNIVNYGIDSTYQNYIQESTWWLWGYSGNGLSKQNFASCEKGAYSGCTSANSGAYSSSTKAKIGLMYVSDYMYASGYYSSSDTTIGSSQYYGNQNWLYQGYEWTITPRSNNSNYAFYVYYHGFVSSSSTFLAPAVRPTFYLKSDVYVTGGDGSFSNPYTIGYGSSSSTDNCTVTDYVILDTEPKVNCAPEGYDKGEDPIYVYSGSSLVSQNGGYVLSGNIYPYSTEAGSLSGNHSATNVFSCCATSSTAVCAEEDLFYITSISDSLNGYPIEITGTSCD